jgi:hypothetical protein
MEQAVPGAKPTQVGQAKQVGQGLPEPLERGLQYCDSSRSFARTLALPMFAADNDYVFASERKNGTQTS